MSAPFIKLNRAQMRVMKRYTAIENRDGKNGVVLKVENQSFWMTFRHNRAAARWYRRMLCVALSRMIEAETFAK